MRTASASGPGRTFAAAALAEAAWLAFLAWLAWRT